MSDDVVIRAEGLGKKYVIGHEAERERYVALRDVLARTGRNAWRKTADMLRGREIVAGDEVEEFWALKDVNFEVRRGEVLGIIGRNGAGKSTLLKILSRITEPSEGRVTIRGRVASLLEVGTGFHPELTGRENIYLNGAILGMTRAEIRRKFDEIVAFAEVEKFLDTPVKRYSSGMYVRLAFAVAAHLEPEILVVDEVLAVGDAAFQKKCLGKMDDVAQSGRTVLFVSHNMQTIATLCNHGLVLSKGRAVEDGDIETAITTYGSQANQLRVSAPHVIFEREGDPKFAQAITRRLELLDGQGVPMSIVASNAPATFRIHYASKGAIPQASFIVSLRSVTGTTLAKFESNPQRLNAIRNAEESFVDCCLENLPLLAGRYFVSVGIAIHGVDFLDWNLDVGTILVIESRDIDLDMSVCPEGTLAIRHRWHSAIRTEVSRMHGLQIAKQ